MQDINEQIRDLTASITGLPAELDDDEIAISATAAFEKKLDSQEVADFMILHKICGIEAALRAALQDMDDPEIGGPAFAADKQVIQDCLDSGLATLPSLKSSLSEKGWDMTSGHVNRVYADLAPRLKLRCKFGKLSAILVSVFVKSIQAKPVIVTEGDPASVERGVRRVISQIAPGLAA